ncbi:GNAT family N-acetyltransferase [Tepidibacter hydrothermalis]|uniref:GNAT family N-acetyltransferase n=1 Tax=Tepidibacter hydrothermalis TaxID=3036126 RepID=A0ABY8EKW9_9FIRM|nr:GNAT family N-acetyltransferase [Tepidibacter hydrothermalis]WFD11833.1 GNAT family N-acetyltransferase [Tepidibacter hydrothermalis]
MKTIQNPCIKLKETINHEDYELINKLQEECIKEDQIALKLELDYKLGITSESSKICSIQKINEFMYFDGQQIIGYIGICRFGGDRSPIEVNGMVHPEYRRQGVFKILSELVIGEWKRRNSDSMLLLSDRKSNSGQQFIKETGAQYKHSEYEMYLKEDNVKSLKRQLCGITFRKATNEDALEINRQNKIYFNDEFQDCQDTQNDNNLESTLEKSKTIISNEDMILPQEEEKKGMTIYIAEKDQKIIGKVHLQLTCEIGGIYGLGVLPEYRRKGFGREILMMAIQKLKELKVSGVMLQVAAENSNALNLYKSCGFIETSTMDYYEIKQ